MQVHTGDDLLIKSSRNMSDYMVGYESATLLFAGVQQGSLKACSHQRHISKRS